MNKPLKQHNIENEAVRLKNIIAQQKQEIFLLKNIIDKLPGSIYWKNKEGVYLGRNINSAESMSKFGFLWKWNEIIGKTDYDLFDREMADKFRENDLYVMRTGLEITQEEIARLPSGEKRVQLSTKRPLRNEEGDIIGVIGNTVDTTHLKKTEDALQAAKEKVEQSKRVKMDFVKNMEHDIRTPFTGVLGINHYLLESETDSQRKELLSGVVQSATELLNFCNEILDFAKIETTPLPIRHEEFNLKVLINKIMAIETPAAKHKQLDFLLDCASKLPQTVVGDERRLHRVLLNLLSNAIKFTDKGQISLGVQLVEKKGDIVILKFLVADTGIGIAKEQQDFIYELFTRITPANKNKYQGLGLGLKIVKQLIQEMQGTIELTSEVNSGSVFTCTLPFKLP